MPTDSDAAEAQKIDRDFAGLLGTLCDVLEWHRERARDDGMIGE